MHVMQFYVAAGSMHACMRAGTTTSSTSQAHADSGNGGDCHGRNHSHSHGHHHHGSGGGGGGKAKPGTTPAAASNPWVISAGAAPRPRVVFGFIAEAAGVIILVLAAAVYWSLTTTY